VCVLDGMMLVVVELQLAPGGVLRLARDFGLIFANVSNVKKIICRMFVGWCWGFFVMFGGSGGNWNYNQKIG